MRARPGKGFLLDPGTEDQQPNYTGVQVQTAVSTLPPPVFYGTVKIGPNIVDAVNFQSQDASSGKGGKGDAKDYSASVTLALGEGPVDSIPIVFKNGTTLQTLSDNGMTLLPGTWPTQAPWSYLVDNYGADAYGYPGIALLVRANYGLGESASVPNNNVVAVRLNGGAWSASWCSPSTIDGSTYPKLAAAFPAGIPTADLALVIQDALTNQQYGIQGFPGAAINTSTLLSSGAATTTGDGAAQTYWRALGLGFGILMDSTESFQSLLSRWLQLGNCAAVWSGTALKIIPYGDTQISANGVTFVPGLTPVYALDDDAYVGDSRADPVNVARTDPNDAYNVCRVEITSDDGWFAFLPVESRDQNAIEQAQCMRIMPTVQGHELVGQAQGLVVAQLLLQQQLMWRNTVTVKLSWEFCLAEPMDWVTLTDPDIGYVNQLCRVLSVEEDENGELTVTLQEYILGSSNVNGQYNAQVTGNSIPDQGQEASSVNTPVIFEPSSTLSTTPQVWFAVCGGGGVFDPDWGGCQVWLSTDNTNYTQTTENITSPSRMGVLTANLAAYGGANPDTTNTLYVDLSESAGTLETVSSGDAANGITLCYVDGELISFETATLAVQTATHEAHTIPSINPYIVYVSHNASWVSDGGVSYAAGGTLAYVSGTPTTGQYTLSGSAYVFSSGDAGKAILITYNYSNPNHYALTTLYRGLYGTAAGAHSSAAQCARLDSATFKYDLPVWAIGKTLYAKFVSFNNFGNGLQDISTLTASTYVPSGSGYGTGSGGVPAAPAGLAATINLNTVSLTWTANASADNIGSYIVQRRIHPGGGWATVGNPVGPTFTETAPATGVEYDYQVFAVNAAGMSAASSELTVTTGSSVAVSTISLAPVTPPSAPASGFIIFDDSTDGRLKAISSADNETEMAQP